MYSARVYYGKQLKYLSNGVAYAEINNAKGGNTTIIGDAIIPSAPNDAKTPVVDNATNGTIGTAIDETTIA